MSAPVLRCVKCQAEIPIPAEVTRTGTGSVVCPACGQRYTRRPPAAPRPATTAGPGPGDGAPAAAAITPQGSTRPLGTPVATAPVLTEGATIAGRYRIVRFLARGGMGEVYEAEDAELRDRVALKTIHPAVALEEGAVERFKREIHLARKVTHPNVCRIFDLGQHVPAPGAEPVLFFTMELLEGETLAARLARAGRLPLERALPIVRQCAAALAAAHAAGVIHRDFERAVVTDFGIARGGADDRFAMTLTSAGGVVGTPAYMAPEQVAGEAVTPAVDQFALGVVLYEMATGELPFRGDTPLATAAKRLTEPAPSPLALVPDLDPVCAAVLTRALARQPGDRFPSVGALVEALEGRMAPAPPPVATPAPPSAEPHAPPPSAPIETPAPAAAPRPRERRQRALAALLLVVLAAASAWAWLRVRELRDKGSALRPAAARRAVAVLGLRNLSGREDAAWLSTALAEMLATELGQSGDLRVVPGDAVARAEVELGFAPSERLSAEARGRLRGRLGADFLVAGAYTALGAGGPLRLDLRLEDARTAETVAAIASAGSEAELFRLVAEAGAGLREKLGAGARGTGVARPLLPVSPEAARLYAEGLDALRQFDPGGARELLGRAVELDPDNALARSALASAWSALGYGERAAAEARRAFERAVALPEPERLMVEARYYEAAGEWGRAAELWQALWSAAPDVLEYGLATARARTAAGDAEAALAVLATLRALPAPESADPRLDLAEAAAAAVRADYPRQAEAAARAAAGAEQVGARLLAAEALVARAWALRNLGRFDEALAGAERSRALAAELGDRGGEAAAGAAAAGVLADRGDLDGARVAYEAALALCRERGDRGGAARILNNLAVVLKSRGELAAARRGYEEAEAIAVETGDRRGAAYAATNVAALAADGGELDRAKERLSEALATFRELADRAGIASALASLGGVERRRGELAAAAAALEESLAVRRSIGQRAGEAAALAALGQVLADSGELEAAGRRFDEALTLARELEQKSAEASALAGLGDLAALAGDAAAAGTRYAEALALRRASGERAGVDRLRLALARLDAERSPAGAAAAASEVLAGLGAEAPVELEAAARLTLARSELARGRGADARLALAPALARLAALGRASALETRLLAARAEAAAGRRTAARAELDEVAAAAATSGLLGLDLEARLAAAELGGAAARAGLAPLAARARDAGFLALAARAEALAAGG